MIRKIFRTLAVLLLIAGISLAAYPSVSKQAVQAENNAVIERFNDTVEDVQQGNQEAAVEESVVNEDGYLIDDSGEVISDYPVVFEKDLDRLLADSIAYNERLKEYQDMTVDFSLSALNLDDYGITDGVFGYLCAPAIGLYVPLYLGASNDNMAWGGAHLMNTSLPIGGESTNAAVAGHTGCVGREIFDNLPYLDIGDTVSVTTYFGTLDYRVVSKKEIGATDTDDLYIVKGKALLTLLTCARYGTARYEVICERAK